MVPLVRVARLCLRAALVLLLLALAAGCMKMHRGGAQSAADDSPIQGVRWDSQTPMAGVTYDEGPGPAGFWARFVKSGQRLEVGKAGQVQPLATLQMNSQADSFAYDNMTEAYRLSYNGALGRAYSVFTGLTPGNSPREPYGVFAFTNAGGTEALYGLLGRAEPAPTSGVQQFNGGSILSRRKGDNAVPLFSAKAQARIDAASGQPELALLLTVPGDLPRLFGRRVGAIQLEAGYDPATYSFRADRGEVMTVAPGGRLRVGSFSLLAQVMNRGGSMAGLFRLFDTDGQPLVIGAFTLQNTARDAPQISKR